MLFDGKLYTFEEAERLCGGECDVLHIDGKLYTLEEYKRILEEEQKRDKYKVDAKGSNSSKN